MPLDVAAIQAALRADGLDGWLLYDFHGSNPIARHVVGLDGTRKMTTRRWYYLVPADGTPRGLVHAIEPHTLESVPGKMLKYAGRSQLTAGLDQLLSGVKRLAMEYSPGGDIPYLARVDAGTAEAIRARGIELVSSGDLVQRFDACWDETAIDTHRAASERLYTVKDRALAEVASRLASGRAMTEYDIQQLMVGGFAELGLVADDLPVVAVNAHAGDPHYQPQQAGSSAIGRDQVLLLDLWGKLEQPGAVYADITWMAYTGARVPEQPAAAFAAIAAARDAAIALVQQSARDGADLRGWQVDRAARTVLDQSPFAAHVLHRTGHSLGETVHGNGVHMDDYETHDDRRLLPGAGFTIEPGLYFDTFGVRTEINMVYGRGDARVTGPVQARIQALA
jgi:Xaa-Pro aminopeptidase